MDSEMMTHATEELVKLASDITPGPWKSCSGDHVASEAKLPSTRVIGWGYVDGFICDLNDGEYHEYTNSAEQQANARAIALVPYLLAEVIRLRESLIAAEFLLKQARPDSGYKVEWGTYAKEQRK